jgi:hypothetical protein
MPHPHKRKHFLIAAILLLVFFCLATAVALAQPVTSGKTQKGVEQGKRLGICPPAQSPCKSLCSVATDCPAKPGPTLCQPDFDCPSAAAAKPEKGEKKK